MKFTWLSLSNPTQPNPNYLPKFRPNPIQPNPWMDPSPSLVAIRCCMIAAILSVSVRRIRDTQPFICRRRWYQVSGYDVLFFPADFPCPAPGLRLTGDHFVASCLHMGRLTKPTQPFIPRGRQISSNPCNCMDYGGGEHYIIRQAGAACGCTIAVSKVWAYGLRLKLNTGSCLRCTAPLQSSS